MTNWIPGDFSGGTALTDQDHLYNTHVNELRTAVDTQAGTIVSLGTVDVSMAGTINSLQATIILLQEQIAELQGSNYKIYCLGDSLTYGYGSGGGNYPQRLQSLLGDAWYVVNNGISGNNTTQMLARLNTEILDARDAAYVIVWGGINDIYQPDIIDLDTAKSNLQAIYTAIHDTGAKVVAINLTPTKGGGTWTQTKQDAIDNLNAWIANTAINIDYKVDAFTATEDPSNADYLLPAYDAGDGLHMQQNGYYKVAETVFATVPFSGSVVLDQQYTGGNNDEYYGYPSPDKIGLGQGFTAGTTGRMTQFSLELKKTGNPVGTTTAYLYSNSSGTPGTAIVTFGTLLESSLTSAYNWYDFILGTAAAPAVTAGSVYHLVVKSSSQDSSNYVRVHANAAGTYAGGYDNNLSSGNTWFLPGGTTTWDLNFKTYVNVA